MTDDAAAVIVAGGRGSRMGSNRRKQYLLLNGVPVLCRTLQVFTGCESIKQVVLVVPEDDVAFCNEAILQPFGLEAVVKVVTGGRERQDSVRKGLEAVHSSGSFNRRGIVLIHDGVRPFVDHGLINRCIKGCLAHGACIPVVSVVDTLKRADADGFILSTVSRRELFHVQTPQAFSLSLIRAAHQSALKHQRSGTDDAALVEAQGNKVFATKGSILNIKITTRDDLKLARAIAAQADAGPTPYK